MKLDVGSELFGLRVRAGCETLLLGAGLGDLAWTLEPCYFVGRLARYWRWLPTEVLETAAVPVAAPATQE